VHFRELGHQLFDIRRVIAAPYWFLQQRILTKIVSGFFFECHEGGARDGGATAEIGASTDGGAMANETGVSMDGGAMANGIGASMDGGATASEIGVSMAVVAR